MKRLGVIFCAAIICASANADWSERLTDAALADYFTRYYCGLKHPERTRAIAEAFDSSKLKAIAVHCEGLTCKNAEHTEGMNRLLRRAEDVTEEELTETCTSYAETLRHIEMEFSDELARGGGLSMGADTSSLKHDFSPGQVWTFRLDAREPPATLTVLKVETLENLGDVVHISVSAVRVPAGITRIGHLPMSRAALDNSVIQLVRTDESPIELGGYDAWKKAKGGVFKTSVGDAMSFVRQAIEKQK